MGLNIESDETPHAENLNGSNDIYIYFKGGFYVWNWQRHAPLNVWFNGDMFTFSRDMFTFSRDELYSTRAVCRLFNEWAGKMNSCTK